MDDVQSGGLDLRAYLLLLKRRKWVILLCTVVVAGSALGVSFLQSPIYQARARLLVERDRSVFDTGSAPSVDPAYLQAQMQVMVSPPVRELVRQRLHAVPGVSVSQLGTAPVIEVVAESPKGNLSASIANAYLDAYVAYKRQQSSDQLGATTTEIQRKVDSIQKRIDELAGQLNALPPCAGTTPSPACTQRETLQRDRDALVSQQVPFKEKLDQVQVNTSLGPDAAALVTPAVAPAAPIRPKPERNGLLGLGVGLVFGIALAFLSEHLDDSIKNKDTLEKATGGLPMLGLIPAVPTWKTRSEARTMSRLEPSSVVAESYRNLRTSIRFLGVDRELRILQITSSVAGEGKTTTVANLGVALARAGEKVVVLSCDLRRPRLHEFFDLPNKVGFTSVLLGETPLSSALQPVPGEEGLFLLGSGPLPPNPSELLSSARAAEVLAALEQQGHVVIIDCPPVLPVTDAAVISTRVHATLLLATAWTTKTKQLTRATEILRQVGAPLVGTVLNNATAETGYGYHYYDYNYRLPEAKPPVSANGKGARRLRQPAG